MKNNNIESKILQNPFEIILDELAEIKISIKALQQYPLELDATTSEDEYLRSIKEISAFIGCSDVKSQSIKNEFQYIFMQTGRKFLVKKTDLLNALKAKSKNKP